MKSILLVKKLLGLVEMNSGLVNANFSLPEWQGVKMIFFAPCMAHPLFLEKATPNCRLKITWPSLPVNIYLVYF